MSLRYLYRKFKPEQRICPGCGRSIQRNIAVHEGELWHYGCLQEAKKKRYRCMVCGAVLSRFEVSESLILGEKQLGCGVCGGDVQPLGGPQPIRIAGGSPYMEVLQR